MTKCLIQTIGWVFSAAALLTVVGACSKKDSAPSAAAPSTPETKAQVVAKLAKADAVDGKVDMVVSKCAACSLGMDGAAEHAIRADGYTLHMCSADCKKGFEKDLDKSILAMDIP